jgi:hypothetical protein
MGFAQQRIAGSFGIAVEVSEPAQLRVLVRS